MARLRHQILDDDRVLISLAGAQQAVRVESGEARRFAWALLSDLDPDEAQEAGYVEPPINYPELGIGRDRAGWGEQMKAIVATLSAGEADTRTIANACQITMNQAAVQLSRLRAREIVRLVRRGTTGVPARWALGPVSIEDWRLRVPRQGVRA